MAAVEEGGGGEGRAGVGGEWRAGGLEGGRTELLVLCHMCIHKEHGVLTTCVYTDTTILLHIYMQSRNL